MDHSHVYLVRQRWQGIKDQDRNFIAAFFHMCTVALVCTSLAALGWFRLRGAPCSPHLAVYQFFTFGHFTMENNPSIPKIITSETISSPYISQYHSPNGVLSCVTPEVASLMRVVILLCFLALCSALCGFMLDIWGPARPSLQLLRRASLPSILAGACAVAATASNLLQLPSSTQDSREQDGQRLVDDWDGMESFSVANYGDTPLESIPPPPYTP
ncbi:hypothetical protein B566_EDAN013223 [Ephemera danica]|nr:hypothetical protein B566_EDAN013223 [Ephemera danica]